MSKYAKIGEIIYVKLLIRIFGRHTFILLQEITCYIRVRKVYNEKIKKTYKKIKNFNIYAEFINTLCRDIFYRKNRIHGLSGVYTTFR